MYRSRKTLGIGSKELILAEYCTLSMKDVMGIMEICS